MRHALAGLAFLIASLGTPGVGYAVDVSLTGSWSETLDSSDLQSGAGSELVSTHESTTSEITVDVSATTGSSDTWRIDVRRSDTVWDSNVRIWVKRTGAGTGSGSISDGTSYQEVTSTDTLFFSGSGDRSGVTLQLKITGASLDVSVDTYSSSLVYTVVDT